MKYLLDLEPKPFIYRIAIHILFGAIFVIVTWIIVNVLNLNSNWRNALWSFFIMFCCMIIIVLIKNLFAGYDQVYQIIKEDNNVIIRWVHYNKKMEVETDVKNLNIEIKPYLRTDSIFIFTINQGAEQITIRYAGSWKVGIDKMKKIKEAIFVRE